MFVKPRQWFWKWRRESLKERKIGKKNSRRLININARINLPFNLPPLLLEALVNRLGNRGFHEVHVAYNERCKNCLQLVMEAAVLEIIWNEKSFGWKQCIVLATVIYHPFEDNRWELEKVEMNPKYLEAVLPKHAPCRTQTSTKTSPRVPPANHWTMQRPNCGRTISRRKKPNKNRKEKNSFKILEQNFSSSFIGVKEAKKI